MASGPLPGPPAEAPPPDPDPSGSRALLLALLLGAVVFTCGGLLALLVLRLAERFDVPL